ncbi:MAG: GDSL-type esterase/lipase family protein [Lachnospiraceae bacterium]|nr:GDSL-type esterase/lipase family protein [Lachnospiraceae bacterium]
MRKALLFLVCIIWTVTVLNTGIVVKAGEVSAEIEDSGKDEPSENPSSGEDGTESEAESEDGETEGAASGDQKPDEDGEGESSGNQIAGESSDTQEPESEEPEEKEERVEAAATLTKGKKSASITWESVEGAVSYQIERSSKKKSGFQVLASVKKSSRKYTDKKVEQGSRYYYRVAACKEDGSTCYSDVLLLECPLGQVSGVALFHYSDTSIKVTWKKNKEEKAKWYKVYYAKKKDGKYQLAGVTKQDWYRVKGLKKNQDYYFRVEACAAKTASGRDGVCSKAAHIKTIPYQRLTIFAGDSITAGFNSYGTLGKISIGGKKKVVAAVGLNTMTFRTKRVFDGKSGVERIVQSQPYRVYIMLGVNDIHYRKKEDVIDGYREIIRRIQVGSPQTDIVVLAAPPVTAAEKEKRSGFAQIPAYNKALKALAKERGVRYYDCTDFLKDSSGWLKPSYAAADGIHWKSFVYDKYAKRLEKYDKSLDKS